MDATVSSQQQHAQDINTQLGPAAKVWREDAVEYLTSIHRLSCIKQIRRNIFHFLQLASDVNKANILDSIDNLLPGGSTNFRSGFELAFQTFQQSDNVEQSSGCHQAILFLTDGEMTDNETAFFDLIDRKRNGYSDSGREPPVMFTYSFGSTAASKAEVPKRIACEYGGVWASIEDGGNLAESMGAYYKYFAQGLGSSGVDSVSWTEVSI